VVGVSAFTASTFRSAGVRPARLYSVHNSVDPQVFTPAIANEVSAAMRHKLGIDERAPLIGCVARLMRGKDQATLVRAFAAVREAFPSARLVLAGTSMDRAPDGLGDYRDYLVRLARQLNVSDAVDLVGFLPYGDMPGFYRALDLLAHPSWEEPFGLALVEAMASERPVLAINGGGVPEIIVDGRDGLLVPRQSPTVMADAIIDVLRDPPMAERLSRSGRARVLKAFTPEQQATRMLEVYQFVVQRRAEELARLRGQPTRARYY
jgi:glycosyltransferase involved in cell wall biosynthesis